MKKNIKETPIDKLMLTKTGLFTTYLILQILFGSVFLFLIPNENLQLLYYMFQTPATIFAALNILRLSSERKDEKNYNKTVYTFDFVRSWDNDNLLKARDFSREIPSVSSPHYNENDIVNKIKHTPSLKSAVILLFNFADSARLGVSSGILDNDVVKNIAPALISILKKYKPYMEKEVWANYDDKTPFLDDFEKTLEILEKLINS